MVVLRDEVIRSLKLNKDLSKLLEQALELDRTIKIGWTRDGEPVPKKDEMGISPALPKNGRIRLLGNLGDMVCILCNEGTFTLEGAARNFFGAWNSGANLIVERDVADFLGYKMNSGKITVRDGTGNRLGSCMSGGLIIARGNAGEKVGELMSGGTIIVHGDIGKEAGLGMTGGRIIVNGRCPKIGNGAVISTLTKKDVDEINKEIEDESLQIPSDVICLIPKNEILEKTIAPEKNCVGNWDDIGITPTKENDSKISGHNIDTITIIGDRQIHDELPERNKLGLKIPIMSFVDSGKEKTGNKIRLVNSNPSSNDLMIVNTDDIASKLKWIKKCEGLVFDISDMPKISAESMDGLIVALRSIMNQEKLLLLSGNIDRVEKLHSLVGAHDLDGCVVNLDSISGAHVSAALPRIGRSIKSNNIRGNNQPTIVRLDWDISAKDVIISLAAGSQIVCSSEAEVENKSNPNTWFEDISAEIRGCLSEMGVDSIEKLSRKNLRALTYETAATTGLRLIGYDRPLPHWFHN